MGINMHLRMPMGLWSWSRMPKWRRAGKGAIKWRSLQAEDFSIYILGDRIQSIPMTKWDLSQEHKVG